MKQYCCKISSEPKDVKNPKDSVRYMIRMGNINSDQLILSGFLRCCQETHIPDDIGDLIRRFYVGSDYIYFLKENHGFFKVDAMSMLPN